MEPVFSDGKGTKVSWRRTFFYPLTENYKITVRCGSCGTVYKAKINEHKEGEMQCPSCSSSVNYKFEIP